ncbi:MAG: hypothetical protein WBU92_07685 [Candidatus Dormiibacterota bacterium]
MAIVLAPSPQEELTQLKDLLGTQGAVASVLGKDPNQVWLWLHKTSDLQPASQRLVDDAWSVVTALARQGIAGSPSLSRTLHLLQPALGTSIARAIRNGRAGDVLAVLKSEGLTTQEELAATPYPVMHEMSEPIRTTVKVIRHRSTPERREVAQIDDGFLAAMASTTEPKRQVRTMKPSRVIRYRPRPDLY